MLPSALALTQSSIAPLLSLVSLFIKPAKNCAKLWWKVIVLLAALLLSPILSKTEVSANGKNEVTNLIGYAILQVPFKMKHHQRMQRKKKNS